MLLLLDWNKWQETKQLKRLRDKRVADAVHRRVDESDLSLPIQFSEQTIVNLRWKETMQMDTLKSSVRPVRQSTHLASHLYDREKEGAVTVDQLAMTRAGGSFG